MKSSEKTNESKFVLSDQVVRILHLPPSQVASIHCTGEKAEIESGNLLNTFVEERKLNEMKPDLRHYGFNHSKDDVHGYERWVTIPEDLNITKPFVKKYFKGGLYAAFAINMGDFDKWSAFYQWVKENHDYTFDFDGEDMEVECLEEHLNYFNNYQLSPDDKTIQIDLLLPIKQKNQQ